MTLNCVLVLVSVFSWVLNGCRGYDCSRVSPKWDQYNGKPFVQLADEQSLKVEVAWNWDSVLAGSNCVQAFEVEHQEFGKGRKTWSQWSSLVNCAIVVQDHQDVTEGNFTCHKFLSSIDCDKRMRFRVLMHNIFNEYRVVTPSRYEEALIQCRPIYQKITESIPITSIRSNLFLVRVPHRKRYQRPTIKPVIPTKGPDIASTTTTSPPTTTAKTTHPTAVNTAATTTVLPKVRDPIQEGNNGTDVSGILSIEYPIPNAVPKHVHRDFFVLLSGKYAKMDTTKKYEVRHNLKDFEATSQHLQYCGKYYVQDISDECDLGKIIRRGMHLCLTSTNDFVSNPEVEAQKGRKFKLFGGQFLRAVAQRCPSPPMKNLVTLGAQHQGVYGFPRCPGESVELCNLMRELLNYGAYTDLVQDILVQAQYWHDPLHFETYVEKSQFIAEINNERPVKNMTYAENMAKLEKFVLIKFAEDRTVEPVESQFFEFYKPGNEYDILPLRESPIYTEDRVGLKTLDLAGKLDFLTIEGADHMQIPTQWFMDNVVAQYLQ